MTSDPPPSPENEKSGLPPRHRLSLENLQEQADEENLWALDEDDNVPTNPETKSQPASSDNLDHHARKSNIPDVKIRRKTTQDHHSTSTPVPETPTLPTTTHPKAFTTQRRNKAPDEIGDIDNWDDAEPLPPSPTPAAPPTPSIPEAPPQASEQSSPSPITSPQSGVAPVIDIPESKKTGGNRKKNSVSLGEKIALAGLAAILLMGTAFFLLNAFKGLPRLEDPYEMPKLPAKGEHLQIEQISSYWRIPLTSGANADTVQRGVELMPVLEITATAANATLRVQFRNSEGAPVGDPVTRSLQGESELTIPSTAGFEDIKVHSAYRTGLIEPWTAEILEAPAGTTTGSAFRTIIRVPISPNRR